MKKAILLFIIILLTGCNFKDKENKNEIGQKNHITTINDAVIIKTTLGKPDTLKAESDFLFRVGNLQKYDSESLAMTDGMNTQILIFSEKLNKIIRKIGIKGSGPGEFLSMTRMKRIGNNIFVLDVMQKKIVVFDENFNYKKQIYIRHLLDDFIILNDSTWIVSNFLLDVKHKPLSFFNPLTEKYYDRFGKIIEPQPGIFKLIEKSPFRGGDIEMFSYGWMTRLLQISNSEFVYSQRNPYTLIKYNLEKKSFQFNVELPYPTFSTHEYRVDGDSRISKINKEAKIFAPFMYNNLIAVVITSTDLQENYLDFYEVSGKFKFRYKIPAFANNVDGVTNVINYNNLLYFLVRDINGISWIEVLEIVR